MDRIEALALWLLDSDLLWWPLLRVRPPRDRPMSARYVALLLACYFQPILVGVLLLLVFGWSRLSHDSVFVLIAALAGGYAVSLVAFLTLAHFWNRRSGQLLHGRTDGVGGGS